MRPFLSEVSRKPQFNHVTFAELDVGAEGTSVRTPSSEFTSISRLLSSYAGGQW